MKLTIFDKGDESVGVFQCEYTIETPFYQYSEKDEIEWFRNEQIKIYSEFSFGKTTALYEWEIKSIHECEAKAFPEF